MVVEMIKSRYKEAVLKRVMWSNKDRKSVLERNQSWVECGEQHEEKTRNQRNSGKDLKSSTLSLDAYVVQTTQKHPSLSEVI